MFKLCNLKKELRPSKNASTSYKMGRNTFQSTLSQCIVPSTSVAAACSFFPTGSSSNSADNFQVSKFKEISEGSVQMQKIKKVQSFFRGWLCRRRWKQIVEQYIKSPHAESMRKRNR